MKFSKKVVAGILFLILFSIGSLQVSAQTVSEQDHNKLVVMEFMETLSTTNYRESHAALVAEDYKRLRSEFYNMRYHAADTELMKAAQQVLGVAIKNRRDVVDVIMAEGDAVAVRYRIQGVHAGNLYGIPATDRSFDIDAAALFWLEDGKITKSWFMADEAGLLRQIGQPLPARKDGRWEAPPVVLPVMTGDKHLADLLKNPVDSQPYRNKVMINAYKSKNPPEGILPPPEEYGLGIRRGFANITDSASVEGARDHPFRGAFPDREDMIVKMMADGKYVMILFRLQATHSEDLFDIPALDRKVSAYEFGFMEFDGEDWAYRWFFGDDLGMLLQMGGSQDYWLLKEDSE